jgi:hypothetical protein
MQVRITRYVLNMQEVPMVHKSRYQSPAYAVIQQPLFTIRQLAFEGAFTGDTHAQTLCQSAQWPYQARNQCLRSPPLLLH